MCDGRDKILYMVRHAQARHNVQPCDYSITDPPLTALGTQQALRIRDTVPADQLSKCRQIISSPMRRCMQTMQTAFSRMLEWGSLNVELLPQLQETGVVNCDVGSSPLQLLEWFPELSSEVAKLPQNWFVKTDADATDEALQARAQFVLEYLYKHQDGVLIVCSHNGFLRHLVKAGGGRLPS